MKFRIIILSLFAMMVQLAGNSQAITRITADSTRLYNLSNTGNELIIENDTRTTTNGFLKNWGNGRTHFALLGVGSDIDTFKLATRAWRQKLADSIASLGYITGTGLSTNAIPYWNGSALANSTLVKAGSALTTQSNLYSPNVNNTPLPNSDTVYVLLSGQSNAGFSANDGANIGDTLQNTSVQIWDWRANAWVIATVNKTPFNIGSASTHSGNAAWYFAKKINEATGKQVKIVMHFRGATEISGWFNGATRGAQMDSLLDKATASGIPRVDAFIWIQGESDPTTPFATYTRSWDSIKNTLRRQSWFPQTTPIIAVGMPQVRFGSVAGYQKADTILRSFDGNSDIWDVYANTDSADVPASQNHYNNIGLKRLGSVNIWNTYNRLPYQQPSTYIFPQYAFLTHNDSIPYSVRYHAIEMQNTHTYGTTGILMKNSSGTDQFRLLTQNPNGSINPFTAGENIISSENNKDLGIYRDFTKKIRVGDSRTYNYNILNVTNTTANSGANIEYQGDGSNFGVSGVGNSTNASVANKFFNYFFGYQYVIDANGNTGINNTAPNSKLSVTGSLSLTVTGYSADHSLAEDHAAFFTTAASAINCYLPTAIGKSGREYIIKKIDNGAGTVIITPPGGQTIDGAASYTLTTQYQFVKLVSNGSNWFVIGD